MGHGGDGATDAGGAALDGAGEALDRSKVHVLLCDKDADSARRLEVLLQECSYQVTAVKSAGQVMEVLDSCSYEVDLILTEVELPREKGFKMLKHIVRQEQLRRIPVVMMSVRDEMAVVVKCLRLGAVDYLLKPLRTNELLNLWTHTWRRRRMLGLTERHCINGKFKVPFDLLVSETSESNNTNSTNLFSDDTDDCKRVMSRHGALNVASREMESEMPPELELSLKPLLAVTAEVAPEPYLKAGPFPSPPKKSELRLGQSSAFLTYAKVSNNQLIEQLVNAQPFAKASNHTIEEPGPNLQSVRHESDGSGMKAGDELEHVDFPTQHRILGIPSAELPSGGPSCPWDGAQSSCRSENGPGDGDRVDNTGTSGNRQLIHFGVSNEGAMNVPSMPSVLASHFLIGGMMNSTLHPCPPLLPPSIQLYHGLPRDDGAGIAPGLPSMHNLPPSTGVPFAYYPFGVHVATPHLGSFHGWPAMVATPVIERKLGHAERREAALNKFRRKRKDRCFEKKIRYVSRKKLAEQRPRIRGQFVRANDMDTNENGVLDEYDDEDDDDGQGLGDLGAASSPESIAEDA